MAQPSGMKGACPGLTGRRGHGLTPIWPGKGRAMAQLQPTQWGLEFWQRAGVAVLVATAILPPHFPNCPGVGFLSLKQGGIIAPIL